MVAQWKRRNMEKEKLSYSKKIPTEYKSCNRVELCTCKLFNNVIHILWTISKTFQFASANLKFSEFILLIVIHTQNFFAHGYPYAKIFCSYATVLKNFLRMVIHVQKGFACGYP